VKDIGMETIPTGYILMDGGAGSTVEFMSGTRPIPMNRSDIAVAHALAGQYLGMKLIYLEAGSGAKEPVANNIVEAVSETLDIPVIVGGGIRIAETASEKVKAGASIIVTGTVIEENSKLMSELADAIHWKN
jgi:putative glycerol-1-phosphate prenyltransferase